MAVTLQGWTGDQATALAGRKPLQALIALSGDGADFGGELGDLLGQVKKQGSDNSSSIFTVTPVVEGLAGLKSVTLGFAGPMLWTLDLEIGAGGEPWPEGVNLLHIAAGNQASNPADAEKWSASTFATVIVPPAVQTKKGGIPKKAARRPGPVRLSRRGT